MKRKLIMITMAVILVVALFAFAIPVASSSADIGAADDGSLVAVTADIAVMDSGTVLVADNTIPASAVVADETFLWLALSATLLTIAVASARRLYKNIGSRGSSDSANEGAKVGGGPNKFILPVSA